MNICLHCNHNVVPYGKKPSYTCPACGRTTAKISKRLKKVSQLFYKLGFRVAAAEETILAFTPTGKVPLVMLYMDFDIAYDMKFLNETIGLPAGTEAWHFRNDESDKLFTRLTYSGDHFPALHMDASSLQILQAVIKTMEDWAEDLITTERNAILVLAGFYSGLQGDDVHVRLSST